MNYMKISKCDIANGPGVRCILWVAGCRHFCAECHNPETHDFEAGQPFDENAYQQIKEVMSRPFIDGITLSGGDPADPKNSETVCKIVERLREDFHDTKTIWLYTGYEFEVFLDILNDKESYGDTFIYRLISNCDVVVDGPFVVAERDIALKFRGSRNQRLVDVKKTMAQNKIVLWEED